MRALCVIILTLCVAVATLAAGDGVTAFKRSGDEITGVDDFFDGKYKPFYHGVASGDPLSDRVILWTRVTPEDDQSVNVKWRIATDPELNNVVSSGEVVTDQSRDYTVKIDPAGLQAATTYYYGFTALGANSITGRTKTAPSDDVERLRFGVVSCSNFQQGFFNAYARLADRNDLDVIVHLGDYIYEYEEGGYGYNETSQRGHEPKNEIVSLEDYRTRYSFYRLDKDLRRAHQQHPFIVALDDHETTNNSWKDGADNHTPGEEGDWQTRKNNALQAYFEWLPIRENSEDSRRTYRTISYGNLADLIMIDTRLEGREQQLERMNGGAIDTTEWLRPDRTMLGTRQRDWLINELNNSQARWKVIGNQIVMMHVDGLQNLDAWDGYPAEREFIFNAIQANNLENVLVITGDVHSTWAGELSVNPYDPEVYNPQSGEDALAAEFVTPSITAANFNEVVGGPPGNNISMAATGLVYELNPHVRFVELDSHGYFLLDLQDNSAQADWWFMDEILLPNDAESFAGGWSVNAGSSQLLERSEPRPDRANPPAPAPDDPPVVTSVAANAPGLITDVVIMSLYPNPSSAESNLHYMLAKATQVEISLYDMRGELVAKLLRAEQAAGAYSFNFSTTELSSGVYRCEVRTASGSAGRSLRVVR